MDNAVLSALMEKLMQFGLTRQEANIYLCLLRNKNLSGYEVSKLTGISRRMYIVHLLVLLRREQHIYWKVRQINIQQFQ